LAAYFGLPGWLALQIKRDSAYAVDTEAFTAHFLFWNRFQERPSEAIHSHFVLIILRGIDHDSQ